MIDHDQLSAMAAVVRGGSFERAARHLGVTPSAISQRVKLLEERLGAVLVVRGQPCRATPVGERLCRHAEEVGLLEKALLEELGLRHSAGGEVVLRIAANADSLATWLVPALAMAAAPGLSFDLVLDDQDHSAEWLRRGAVSAAVSKQAGGVRGCGQHPLGALRYLATASPAFVATWFAGGIDAAALTAAPSLRFNAKDELQARWARIVCGRDLDLPCHRLPSSHAFVDAALAGLGWGMNPQALAAPHLASGALVELLPGRPYDVPLFWQWSRVVEGPLAGLTQSILAAARRGLVQTGG